MNNVDCRKAAKEAMFAYICDLTGQADVCRENARKLGKPGTYVGPVDGPLTVGKDGKVMEDKIFWQVAWGNVRKTQRKFAAAYLDLYGDGRYEVEDVILWAKNRLRTNDGADQSGKGGDLDD